MILNVHRAPDTQVLAQLLVDSGASCFELDVRLGPGGEPVVSHFLPALRIPGWLENDGWKLKPSRSYGGRRLLREAFAAVPDGCDVVLDLKEIYRRRRVALNDALVRLDLDKSRVQISTGSLHDLTTFRQHGFRTWRTVSSRRELEQALTSPPVDDFAVSLRHSLATADTVCALHEKVRHIVAWTVNDTARAAQLRKIGIDGITTDRSAVVRALVMPPAAP